MQRRHIPLSPALTIYLVIALICVFLGYDQAAALSPADYKNLLAKSAQFRAEDKNLTAIYNQAIKELSPEQRENIHAAQKRWLDHEVDIEAGQYMSGGTAKDEAYSRAFKRRASLLQIFLDDSRLRGASTSPAETEALEAARKRWPENCGMYQGGLPVDGSMHLLLLADQQGRKQRFYYFRDADPEAAKCGDLRGFICYNVLEEMPVTPKLRQSGVRGYKLVIINQCRAGKLPSEDQQGPTTPPGPNPQTTAQTGPALQNAAPAPVPLAAPTLPAPQKPRAATRKKGGKSVTPAAAKAAAPVEQIEQIEPAEPIAPIAPVASPATPSSPAEASAQPKPRPGGKIVKPAAPAAPLVSPGRAAQKRSRNARKKTAQITSPAPAEMASPKPADTTPALETPAASPAKAPTKGHETAASAQPEQTAVAPAARELPAREQADQPAPVKPAPKKDQSALEQPTLEQPKKGSMPLPVVVEPAEQAPVKPAPQKAQPDLREQPMRIAPAAVREPGRPEATPAQTPPAQSEAAPKSAPEPAAPRAGSGQESAQEPARGIQQQEKAGSQNSAAKKTRNKQKARKKTRKSAPAATTQPTQQQGE